MVDTVLIALSVIEREGVAYTVHQGSLLGATRLEGLLPWDIDGDIALIGENADTAAARLQEPLAQHGLAFIFDRKNYYYTIRPLAFRIPMVEVILMTETTDPLTGEIWHDRHSPARMFGLGELLPLTRYGFHGSQVMGPANAEPVLKRLYGAGAARETLQRFNRPALPEETAAFWSRARPMAGEPDYSAIAARATLAMRSWRRIGAAAPWYYANGLYNKIVERSRELAGG